VPFRILSAVFGARRNVPKSNKERPKLNKTKKIYNTHVYFPRNICFAEKKKAPAAGLEATKSLDFQRVVFGPEEMRLRQDYKPLKTYISKRNLFWSDEKAPAAGLQATKS
jgi:hypothetical protein